LSFELETLRHVPDPTTPVPAPVEILSTAPKRGAALPPLSLSLSLTLSLSFELETLLLHTAWSSISTGRNSLVREEGWGEKGMNSYTPYSGTGTGTTVCRISSSKLKLKAQAQSGRERERERGSRLPPFLGRLSRTCDRSSLFEQQIYLRPRLSILDRSLTCRPRLDRSVFARRSWRFLSRTFAGECVTPPRKHDALYAQNMTTSRVVDERRFRTLRSACAQASASQRARCAQEVEWIIGR
jgi:hypothetical protein